MDQSVQSSDSPQQQDSALRESPSSKSVFPDETVETVAYDTRPTSVGSKSQGVARDQGRAGRGTKRKDLGRRAWGRQWTGKNHRNDDSPASKRQKTEDGESSAPIYATQFSQEDIDADQRRPKKKAAVLLGYSGTGYHGLQLSHSMKTIEGELFAAFVAAGAISKANATDPKKSALARCARTDKGVHAAGNVVSLKLIVEDPDVVEKINQHLSPQIRVWGIETATKSFSCYQSCDSRVYEYLIPSHCFLPPHPSTFLARKLHEIAHEQGALEEYETRQEEVRQYWEEIDDKYIKPILARLPEEARKEVQESLCIKGDISGQHPSSTEEKRPAHNASDQEAENTSTKPENATNENDDKGLSTEENVAGGAGTETTAADQENNDDSGPRTEHGASETLTVNEALGEIRAAYFKAKEDYRIHPARQVRINEALARYVGTRNFHNYTVRMPFNNPSAKRVIRSFQISRDPIIINGTEWLSLKVHGQSFMMHQIRKMVSMVALLVRCGTPSERITESYGPDPIAIPRAPGLGLLLERPIFDNYNQRATQKFNKNPIDFSKYDKEIEEFKEREIYQRIFRQESEAKEFGNFFNHIDTFPDIAFLYLTAGGIPAANIETAGKKKPEDTTALEEFESASENEDVNDGEEGG